jgi:hypothetical protein
VPNSYNFDIKLLERLGLVVIYWASIEESLGNLLAYLLNADRGPMYAVTQNVSDSTVTDWIRTLVSIRQTDSADTEALREVLAETDRLRSDRNRLVHGLWRVGPSPETAFVHTARLDRREVMTDELVTASDLEEFIQDIKELSIKFSRIGRHFGYLPGEPTSG